MADEATTWGGQLWAKADLATPMAIRVAATLRIADQITAGRRTAAELAAATDADLDPLTRILEHLVSAGVLSKTAGDFGLTSVGEGLCDDHPDGVRAWLDLEGAVGRADTCFVQMLHTARTGEPAFPRQFGRPFWEDLSADPVLSASFDALMGSRLGEDRAKVASGYPWGTLGHIVDVGGGDGSLLIALLQAHNELHGTVLDLAGPVAQADRLIAAAGLADRAEARPGSFFDALPAGAGGYLLSGVLHDWDDDDARRILRRCVDAAPSGGKIFVVDHIWDEDNKHDTEGDLRMLCYFLGRERTLGELTDLAASVGLRMISVTPAGLRSIIELAE